MVMHHVTSLQDLLPAKYVLPGMTAGVQVMHLTCIAPHLLVTW